MLQNGVRHRSVTTHLHLNRLVSILFNLLLLVKDFPFVDLSLLVVYTRASE